MFWDRRKKYTVVFKVDEYELGIIEDACKDLKTNKGEAIRRALWVWRVLYDPRLLLKDAVKERNWSKPLCDILKPLPELTHRLGLEIKLWREKHHF